MTFHETMQIALSRSYIDLDDSSMLQRAESLPRRAQNMNELHEVCKERRTLTFMRSCSGGLMRVMLKLM